MDSGLPGGSPLSSTYHVAAVWGLGKGNILESL